MARLTRLLVYTIVDTCGRRRAELESGGAEGSSGKGEADGHRPAAV
jgi:hypothetical protein